MIHKIKIEAIVEVGDEEWDVELLKETKDLYSVGTSLIGIDEMNNKGVKITDITRIPYESD